MSRRNWLPDLIPIARMEDYHTHYLGQCADRMLFWGYLTFAFEASFNKEGVRPKNWREFRREYVILHLFDSQGNYIKTHHWFAGKTSGINLAEMDVKLEEMVSALGAVAFGDISVKPFQTEIDGIAFGLIPNDEDETVDLQPSSTISFQKPWDGEYYT